MAGDGAPFAAEDVYVLAALEALLGHGSDANCGGRSQPGSGTADAQQHTPPVPPDVEQPPDRSTPVAPPAGWPAADDPARDDCDCRCCFNSAHGRRAWWLGAVVALAFAVQIALAVLVLLGAMQAPKAPKWSKPLREVAWHLPDNQSSWGAYQAFQVIPLAPSPGSRALATRHALVQKLYDEALNSTVCPDGDSDPDKPDALCSNPYLAAKCSCVVPVPSPSKYSNWWEDNQGCGNPTCFLCSRNTTWRECNISVSVDGGKPLPAWEQQNASVKESIERALARMDTDRLRSLQGQLRTDGLDWGRVWPWGPALTQLACYDLDPIACPMSTAAHVRGVAVSVAVVLIAIYCHREVARAHRLARLVLTHTCCMPAFFTPLSLVGSGVTASGFVAAGLLLLPLLQLCTALVVLLAASTVFGLSSQTKDPISMVFNSAALLFVLELDNVVGGMVRERTRTAGSSGGREVPGEARVRERRMATAGTWPARLLGHVYVALLGAACFAELLFATNFVAVAYATVTPGNDWLDSLFDFQKGLASSTFLSQSRLTLASICTFVPLYTLVVAVLFDPPLPTASVAWSIAARACMVAAAVVFSVLQIVGSEYMIFAMLFFALPCAAAAWLALYALVPWARACHVARRPLNAYIRLIMPEGILAPPCAAIASLALTTLARAWRRVSLR